MCKNKGGKPWTQAIVAIYRVEVGCLPSVAGTDFCPGVIAFMNTKMKEDTSDDRAI
jgi:hypothetical protein